MHVSKTSKTLVRVLLVTALAPALGCSSAPEGPPLPARDDALAARGSSGPAPDDEGVAASTPFADPSTRDGGSSDGAPAGLWVSKNALSCTTSGDIGAVFRGVPIYCQPPGASGFYQCDELANRFLRDTSGHPNLDNVVTEFASSMCAKAAASAAYSVWGSGYRDPQGHRPGGGDLVVWAGAPGHVAVVTHATSADVSFVQQNTGRATGSVAWNGVTAWPTECWIHPEPIASTPAAHGSDCGCFAGEGDYCGLSVVDHAAWYACTPRIAGGGVADYGHLYTCAAGLFTATRACSTCITDSLTVSTGSCRNP